MSLPLIRLLQLASPALPVGAYSYSQGLEAACEAEIVRDKDSARQWIGDVLQFNIATMEAPIFARLYRAWQTEDLTSASYWNHYFLASRETAELRAETEQMGYSLAKLLVDGKFCDPAHVATLANMQKKSFPKAFSFAAVSFSVALAEALTAYLWSWLENQVIGAVKLVPLGQVAGQALMFELGQDLPGVVEHALSLADEALCNFSPGLAILSGQHETQYSRLFRS
ncbi:MAG: urease accessory protein UreF [Pseudomonadota bacterium]|nr:urease accessory protein UreF [Pseudomonadota bacterium]